MTVCCRCVHAVLLLLLHGLAVVRNGSRKSARAEELKCACNECDELCFHWFGPHQLFYAHATAADVGTKHDLQRELAGRRRAAVNSV